MKCYPAVFGLILLTSQIANGQQWSGNSNLTDPISRTGAVGIGGTPLAGGSKLDIFGPSGFDTAVRLRIINGATDYGRTNLVITGRIQSNNDAWSFGSDARSSIVFSANGSASGVNVGGLGTEQFSIQHEMVSNTLGFMTATKGAAPTLTLKQNGFVGIGTASPDASLHVQGGIVKSADQNYSDINVRLDGQSIPALRFTRYTGATNGYHNAFVGQYYDGSEYAFALGIGSSTTGDQTVTTKAIIVRQNGNVGIGLTGTNVPDSKLSVNGQVHATEVRVSIAVPGPDYVFNSDYDLPSLETVRSYIDQHHHLPEVPSAKEMETDGVKVGEMNMILLKKIEELTLYVLDLKKENVEMKKEISELKSNK